MTRAGGRASFILPAIALTGCLLEPETDDIGTAEVAIAQAPTDALCLRITVTGTRTAGRSVDLATGQSTGALTLGGLPLGTSTFSADAFAVACSAVAPSSVATWVAAPVTVTLFAGVTANVSLVMRRNGQAVVSVDFEDDAPPAGPTVLFGQDWSNASLLSTSGDWSGVPGIIGYLGDTSSVPPGTDPQTLLGPAASTTIFLAANQTDVGLPGEGVAEFELANPTIALKGSDMADAPNLVVSVSTIGLSSIEVSYTVRGLEIFETFQSVALQYRVGSSGNFANLPAAFVPAPPLLPELLVHVRETLPADADDQPLVQLRIMTVNGIGDDVWIGIDDLLVMGDP